MKLPMAEEMRKIDKRSIEEIGIPEVVLMENASREIYQALNDLLATVDNKEICILAGTGNNGGDAFAAARHISNAGAKVKIFVTGDTDKMSPSAAVNFNIACNMGLDTFVLKTEHDWDKLALVLKLSDAVVDGMVGTGFSGVLRESVSRAVDMVNESGLPVLSVDIPSGVNADTGEVIGKAIKASVTLTLGAPKWGMLFSPGANYVGKLLVDGIGIPNDILEDASIQQDLLTGSLVKPLIKTRPLDCHKGTCGRVLVIAGSTGMTGAACLAAEASLKAGAGIVTLACASKLNDVFETKLTEVMTAPVGSPEKGYIGVDSLERLLELARNYDIALIGPGLGREDSTREMVRGFIEKAMLPIVIDADALYALRDYGAELKKCHFVPILTPHLGELANLLNIPVVALRENLLEYARGAAAEYNAIIVAKSESTIVVYPDGRAFVSSVGNSGMATAGSGDVLAGTIAGLCKQVETDAVALAGVYIHGRAGDLASENKGDCLVASDISGMIAKAMIEVKGK